MIILSQRESECVPHLCLGLSNKQIARKLGCSEPTVKNHVVHMLTKCQATNRTAMAVLLATRGFKTQNQHRGVLKHPVSDGPTEYDSWVDVFNLTLTVKLQGPGEEEYISWFFCIGEPMSYFFDVPIPQEV